MWTNANIFNVFFNVFIKVYTLPTFLLSQDKFKKKNTNQKTLN